MNWTSIDSPIGPLLIAVEQDQLCAIEFGDDEQAVERLRLWVKNRFPTSDWIQTERDRDSVLAEVAKQLEQYFAGERMGFDVPVNLRGTPFQLRVWEALRSIPYGQTRSYKDIAEQIDSRKAVRAVGGANNRNPLPIIVPCHRVIGAKGALVGYGGGIHIKEKLLHLEGL